MTAIFLKVPKYCFHIISFQSENPDMHQPYKTKVEWLLKTLSVLFTVLKNTFDDTFFLMMGLCTIYVILDTHRNSRMEVQSLHFLNIISCQMTTQKKLVATI